uniref:Zinc finger protein 512B n=1 Tax=Loxodonta africana TaxID=9785 RepID=G3TXH7_LOXAF
MTDPFCVGGGRRLPGSSKSGSGKDPGRTEVLPPVLHDPPKLGMPVVRSGQTVPSQAPLCFDPGSPASDRTEGKKKGRPKAENQALRDIPLSLMNQWKDEFKAHSRVKCPNSGCWLEFPSIYGLKYHYQRCQGVRDVWLGTRRPGPTCLRCQHYPAISALPTQGAISERLTFPCPFCEAAFTSKTQLEKHRIWNHMDRPLPAPKPGPVSRPVTISRPVGVSKPIGVSKPVTIGRPVGVSKPIGISKPVPVSRPVPVTKPVTVSRPVPVTKPPTPVTKPIPITKSIPITKPVPVTKPVTINKPMPVTKSMPVTKPPMPVSKPVPVSRPVAISRPTPPCKMVLLTKSENKTTRAVGRNSGKKRAADGLDSCPVPPKQVRPENGECGPSTMGQSSGFQLGTHPPSSRASGAKEAPRATGPASLPEEDPERMKHSKGSQGESGWGGLRLPGGPLTRISPVFSPRVRKETENSQEGALMLPCPPQPSDGSSEGGEQEERERLRKVLKQMGKLRCPQEGCGAAFSSLMGYQYHQRRCGKPPCELDSPSFPCAHCGKTYRSKAGHDYHVRSEHAAPLPEEPTDKPSEADNLLGVERTPSGRIRRTSAQVAVFHLQEIAEDELARDWTKRRMKDDLVPETARLNYTRPGLPTLDPQLLEVWKNEVKEKGHVNCPNDCCEAIYSSVSGLKAHLASCSKGDHLVGKYRCLLCPKEFSSESGVKYHILKTHAENCSCTSADPPLKHRSRDSLAPQKEKKKSAGGGKKRGRKPRERPQEEPTPKLPPGREDWPSGGRDKGGRGSTGRKVGAGKAPEK